MSYITRGQQLREELKNLVYEYMSSKDVCSNFGDGLKQAEIFRDCGLDFGDKDNCTSSQQQYYIVAILRELEEERKVKRDIVTKKWTLN